MAIQSLIGPAAQAAARPPQRVHQATHDRAHALAQVLAGLPADVSTDTLLHKLAMGPSERPKLLRWLDAASQMGLVEREQDPGGRAILWRAADQIQRERAMRLLARPEAERPAVGYNEDFLASYEPGRTHYLSRAVRERLARLSRPGSASFEDLSPHDKSLFLCGLTHGSSALEGNSYSRLETVALIEEGLIKRGASERETFMVLNHHDAVQYILGSLHFPPRHNDVDVRAEDVRNLHALLSYHLLSDAQMCGMIRHRPVRIQHSPYRPPAVGIELARGFQTICDKARAIPDPFEAAFFVLVHLPYLQPFVDCNKRTSRVVCNIPLLRRGALPVCWAGVDATAYQDALCEVYENNTTSLLAEVFERSYERSAEEFDAMQLRALDGPPDIAMRYRNELRLVVLQTIREGEAALPETVAGCDRARFEALVRGELQRLGAGHRGTMVQYGLGEDDLERWRQAEVGGDADGSWAFSVETA